MFQIFMSNPFFKGCIIVLVYCRCIEEGRWFVTRHAHTRS